MSRTADNELRIRSCAPWLRDPPEAAPAEALADCIEKEGMRGRHRVLRAAAVALEEDGFVPALRAVDFVSAEVAAVLIPHP